MSEAHPPRAAGRRGKRHAAVLLPIALLVACETIEVRPQDGTGPLLTVYLIGARGLAAEHRDGRREPVEGLIETGRLFAVRVRNARHSVAFVFAAHDRETGIQDGLAQLWMEYDCLYLYPGERIPERYRTPEPVTFPSRFGSPPAAVGERTPPSAATALSFDFTTLWGAAGCVDHAPRRAPYRRGIVLTTAYYSIAASNNGTSRVARSGPFYVESADTIYLDP